MGKVLVSKTAEENLAKKLEDMKSGMSKDLGDKLSLTMGGLKTTRSLAFSHNLQKDTMDEQEMQVFFKKQKKQQKKAQKNAFAKRRKIDNEGEKLDTAANIKGAALFRDAEAGSDEEDAELYWQMSKLKNVERRKKKLVKESEKMAKKMADGTYVDSDEERDPDGDLRMGNGASSSTGNKKTEEDIAKKVVQKLVPKKGEDALKGLAKYLKATEDEEAFVAKGDKFSNDNTVSATTEFCKTVETAQEKEQSQKKETYSGMALYIKYYLRFLFLRLNTTQYTRQFPIDI